MTMNFMGCLMRNEMTTTDLIKSHEECINVLEAIKSYEARIENAKWNNLHWFVMSFPKIIKENEHRIEIWQKCIERLKLRYDKLKRTI